MEYGVKYRIVSILDSVRALVKRNPLPVFIFVALYITGFIVGICISVRAEDAKASLTAVNWLLSCYAIKNMNIFFVFLLHLLYFTALALIFALLTYKIYFSFVFGVIFIYMGMSVGGPLILLFRVFGLGALVVEAVAFILFELIFAVYFILLAAHMFTVAVENHRYGCNCSFICLIKPLGQQFLILAAVLVVQSFLLFICSVFIL